MLKIENLITKYNDNIIINDVTYNFLEGNIYLLTGENGSGKSTILKSIAKLITYQGKIEPNGVVGFLPDKVLFPPLLGSYEYLYNVARLNNSLPKVKELIDILEPHNKIIASLSKGNTQKIGIIQLLSLEADIYLLDEPFDGLDAVAKTNLKKLLLQKKEENKIVIISIHDKKIFSSKDVKTLEIRGGKIYEKKDKHPKPTQTVL